MEPRRDREVYLKQYYHNNRLKINAYHVEYCLKNKDHIKKNRNKSLQNSRDYLYGSYIKKLLSRRLKISMSIVTTEMIELERDRLLLYREIKKLREVLNGST